MAGKNLRKKSNQEVGNLKFVVFHVWCFYCEGRSNESWMSQRSTRVAWADHARSRESELAFHCISTDKGILRLEHYWRFMIKTSQRLILYFVWHVSTNCNMTFRLNIRLDLPARREFGLCTKCVNKKEVFGHKLWTLSNKSNIYCGTWIPGSAFWWRS
jgi:hypothetical protein